MTSWPFAIGATPDIAARYTGLKRGLAVRHAYDREAYAEGKSAFVVATLRGDAPSSR